MKSFFFALFLITSGLSFSQDCEKYKTGEFIIRDEATGVSRIVRDKKFQTEYNGGNYAKYKVHWIDGCSYRLSFVKSNDPAIKEAEKNGFPELIIEIIETGDDYYIARAKLVGTDVVMDVRMNVAK